jgi:hypothetical protein
MSRFVSWLSPGRCLIGSSLLLVLAIVLNNVSALNYPGLLWGVLALTVAAFSLVFRGFRASTHWLVKALLWVESGLCGVLLADAVSRLILSFLHTETW